MHKYISILSPSHPLWQLGFRSFFLAAAMAGIASLFLWVIQLSGTQILYSSWLNPLLFHIHEMMFGFAATVVVGFILTAVQTWTKRPSLSGLSLMLMTLIWLTTRISLHLEHQYASWITILSAGLWWAFAIGAYSHIVVMAKNRRNYLFIGLLSLLASLHVSFLLAAHADKIALALHLARSATLGMCIIIGVVGGRVIPLFTRNALAVDTTQSRAEKVILPVSLIGFTLFVQSYFQLFELSPAWFMALAGSIHLWRLSGWQSYATRNTPLLWSLHLAYGAMSMGLLLMATSYWLPFMPFSIGLHTITVGGISLMIFAMMSRVSLGHTGRPLQPSPLISFSFALLGASALLRISLPVFGFASLAWSLSAALWITSALCFLWVYTPILMTPRRHS